MHSKVYKGRKKQTIEYYAIKSVQKSQKQRVHQEVRKHLCSPTPAPLPAASPSLKPLPCLQVKTIHDLRHPNILRFHNWYAAPQPACPQEVPAACRHV